MTIFNAIKTYRTELMGIAILWVVLYHIHPQNKILTKLTVLGYGGVDIFLLVSGFGLYYSYRKTNDVIVFWKKRLLRIFPTYLFFVAIYLLLHHKLNISNFLVYGSTLAFWFSSTSFFEWYVPSLLLLYLIAPLFIRIISFNTYLFAISTVFFTLITIISWNTLAFPKFQMMCYSRIPIFMLGIYISYISQKQGYRGLFLYQPFWIIMSIVGISFLHFCYATYSETQLWQTALYWLPFIVIVPGLIMISGYLLKCQIKGINSVLLYFGKISFELYLTHIIIFEWLNAQNNDLLNNGISKVVISVTLASLVHYCLVRPLHTYMSK